MGPLIQPALSINPATLDFELPEDRIAQAALPQRDEARLMVLNRVTGEITHCIFKDLVNILTSNDVVVLNNTRVNHAKFYGKKKTGGRVEIIFIEPTAGLNEWKALVRPFVKENSNIILDIGKSITIKGHGANGENIVYCHDFNPGELMEKKGLIPLPPYIKREKNHLGARSDEQDYQTVYAQVPGSIAAPTAGLHFTEKLLEQLRAKGIQIIEVLLNVGWGTFKPVSGGIDSHQMLPERYEVTSEAFLEIKKAKEKGKRIISVGTTSTRVLESLPNLKGETRLFIKPGFEFKWVSGLITNFHVPRSTPIALTAAFGGLKLLEKAYALAIEKKYRFYSYGDAMLIM